jgi:hypothetical protein
MKWDEAKLRPIQRRFRNDQREREDGQRLSTLEAVKAIAKRMRELRPVASIAWVIAGAFHPASPKLITKPTTMRQVTKVVIRQPCNVMANQPKHKFA